MYNCVNRNKNVKIKNEKSYDDDNNDQKAFENFSKHFSIIENAKQHVSQKKNFSKKTRKKCFKNFKDRFKS